MTDPMVASELNLTIQPKTFEQLKAFYSSDDGGAAGDALYQKIIKAAQQQTQEMGCFVAGTLVHTKEGLRPIEQIKVGDYVLSKPESGERQPGYQKVTRTFEHDDREVYLVSWTVVDSPIPWAEQEPAFVVVTGAHPFWVKRFVDRDDNSVREINAWMSIEEFYNINFEFNWVHNKSGVDAQVELHDGRVAQLGSVRPLLRSREPDTGVAFKDSVYWGENASGPEVRFGAEGPVVAKRPDGLFAEVGLDVHDAIDYEQYPERSLTRRSKGFLPMRRKVFNIEVETNHSYYVGKTGVWVHNISGIVKTPLATTPAQSVGVYAGDKARARFVAELTANDFKGLGIIPDGSFTGTRIDE